MKLLITGANSYVGTNVSEYLSKNTDIQCDTLDMLDEKWRDFDFSLYDAVYHVAGIAHADVSKATEETKKLYYKVNCDLAFETAQKAKEAGVKQFIFMSSMLVYGDVNKRLSDGCIKKDTKPLPENFYGDSKLQAEIKLNTLRDESFKIAILRPPMIYGKNCKGNYKTLEKMANKLPIFPEIANKRSVLHIDILGEFVGEAVKASYDGVYFPQMPEYKSTSQMVREIAEANGKKIKFVKFLNPFVRLLMKMPGKYGKLANKAFGNAYYER